MKVTLVAYTQTPPNQADKTPVEIIEQTACNCYDSIPKTKGNISKHCYKSGHLSVFEFAQFHFHIEGVSRALLAQLTRHRTGKFCVRSQRYCSEDNFKYVIPPTINNNTQVVKEYKVLMNHINWFYKYAQLKGIPNEDSRFILPNACETTLDVSFDLRNLMHFMNERLCNKAQWEIRELAKKMRDCVLEVEPDLKPYLVPKCIVNGKCNESKSCGKELIHNEIKLSEKFIKSAETAKVISENFGIDYFEVCNVLNKIQGADVQEVKHAKWELIDECSNEGVYCSNCHKKVYCTEYANQKVKSKFCPNCGSKMRSDEK